MPVRAHLKQIWENNIASCFAGQPGQAGDEPTRAPVATSRGSSLDTKPSLKKPETLSIYPFPIFFIILVLVTLIAPPTSAHALEARGDAFADYFSEQNGPTIKLVSAAKTRTFRAEQDAQADDVPASLMADTMATSKVEPSGEQQDAGKNGVESISKVKIMAASKVRTNDSGDVSRDGNAWVVSGVGRFKKRAVYTFDGDTLPAGLTKSDYSVQCRESQTPNRIPYNERFDPANVILSNGSLQLLVPGGQRPTKKTNYAISCAEVTTVEQNIFYGSFRTTAIFSQEPGTCHGIFFYKSDTQETDIEYLTDPLSQSNNGPDMPIPIWYTNQAIDPEDVDKTSQSGPAPINCTTCVHEYRIDWTKDFTAFYVDGKRQQKFTINVPTKPGPFVWNNWANGDIGWSAGPPQQDNTFQIMNITMYYNTAKNGSSTSGSVQGAQE